MALSSFVRDVPTRLYLIFFVLAIQASGEVISWYAWTTGSMLLVSASVVVWLLWFSLVFTVARPSFGHLLVRYRKAVRAGAAAIGLLVAIVAIGGAIAMPLLVRGAIDGSELALELRESVQYGDDTATVHYASELLLSGVNPYPNFNIIAALNAFGASNTRTTPLRQGYFQDMLLHPSDDQLREAVQRTADPMNEAPEEFGSELCYPAGSFILPAPFVAIGLEDIRIFYLLCALVMAALALLWAPRNLRLLVISVFVANLLMWFDIASGRTDCLYVLFVLLGWVLRRHIILSALFMGVAVAVKQIALAYVLFYLILQLREFGWRQTLSMLGLISLAFVVFNAPFIADSPRAWLSAVMAEVAQPYFPGGVGIVAFASVDVLPLNRTVFVAVEATALFISAIWYYFNCRRYPHTGLLLAALPFFFAWHSYSRYLYFAPLLIFIALIADRANGSPGDPTDITNEGGRFRAAC